MALTAESRAAVEAALEKEPGAVIEAVAEENGVTPADVIACLPTGQAVTVDGSLFESVMQEIAGWGEVTFIVNTPDLIFEAKGEVPKGSMGRGYYNLFGKPIGGHLKADNCASVSFVSRKLFSSDTHSVQFYNKDGGCMFKIYLGRDKKRNLIPEQVAKFAECRDRMQTENTAA